LYYDVGPKGIQTYIRHLHTDPEEGTYYKEIVRYAGSLGLNAEVAIGMSPDVLRMHIDEGEPVICSIQAYSDDPMPDYSKNGNGHYVVAIGYDDDDNYYFMDPSANYEGVAARPRYGVLSRRELELRWHEDEGMHGNHEVHSGLGIIVYPNKGRPNLRARKIE